jgi:hypothetical protein
VATCDGMILGQSAGVQGVEAEERQSFLHRRAIESGRMPTGSDLAPHAGPRPVRESTDYRPPLSLIGRLCRLLQLFVHLVQ